ncbi:MAG: tRNA (adenosine(37)-N6)-dimethylallyltransferase MiaA [Spirochaetaceae bacterium]|nr:tRNA (adenosine(37)-N6)-dimethylallyltransferase MiaA [Spirochaetaceae bacterium]
MKIPVLVLFGPTASGKTALVERLFSADAQSVFAGKAEIISADSMQIYKGMNIGTATPCGDELKKLPHNLINLYNPDEQFGAGVFVSSADEAAKAIYARGKLPVLAGGTAFYIKNFLYGLPVTPESDEDTRRRVKEQMKTLGAEAMHKKLSEVDPVSAARIHVNDEYRIVRALEVYASTGRPLSSFILSETLRGQYDFCVIAIERPRDELYERINRRVEKMMQDGLKQEFDALIDAGYKAEDPGMQAIGYREFFMVASKHNVPPKDAPLDEVTALIQHDSRKYAKRQMTFFKSIGCAKWIAAADTDAFEREVTAFYRKFFGFA